MLLILLLLIPLIGIFMIFTVSYGPRGENNTLLCLKQMKVVASSAFSNLKVLPNNSYFYRIVSKLLGSNPTVTFSFLLVLGASKCFSSFALFKLQLYLLTLLMNFFFCGLTVFFALVTTPLHYQKEFNWSEFTSMFITRLLFSMLAGFFIYVFDLNTVWAITGEVIMYNSCRWCRLCQEGAEPYLERLRGEVSLRCKRLTQALDFRDLKVRQGAYGPYKYNTNLESIASHTAKVEANIAIESRMKADMLHHRIPIKLWDVTNHQKEVLIRAKGYLNTQ